MTSVLYDAPGPRARRRTLIGSLVAGAVLLAGAALVVKRLADQDQFSAEKWGPLVDPSTEEFPLVWRLIGQGLVNTLTAAVISVTLSLVLGTAIVVGRLMAGRVARMPLIGVIEVLRGLPVVISIYFASRVLPELGLSLPLLWYLVIGLTAYNSVVIAEIIRAGVASLPRGQSEAALAVGLTRWQTLRLVQLPQAFRTMLPALLSQLVVVLKDTSLVAVLGGYTELLRQGNIIVQNLGNPMQVFFVIGLIYIAMNMALTFAAGRLEARSRRAPRTAATVVDQPAPAQ